MGPVCGAGGAKSKVWRAGKALKSYAGPGAMILRGTQLCRYQGECIRIAQRAPSGHPFPAGARFWSGARLRGLAPAGGQRGVLTMKMMRTFLIALPLSCAFAATASADMLSGTWSGSGSVSPKEGKTEAVRCKVTYSPEGSAVSVTATCASSSTTIHQTGSLSKVSDSKYVGDFYNSQYDISGRVRVTISGSSQTVTFSSPRGSGSLHLSRR